MRVVIVIKIDDDLVKGLDCKSSNRLGDFESGIGFGLMAPVLRSMEDAVAKSRVALLSNKF